MNGLTGLYKIVGHAMLQGWNVAIARTELLRSLAVLRMFSAKGVSRSPHASALNQG